MKLFFVLFNGKVIHFVLVLELFNVGRQYIPILAYQVIKAHRDLEKVLNHLGNLLNVALKIGVFTVENMDPSVLSCTTDLTSRKAGNKGQLLAYVKNQLLDVFDPMFYRWV